MILAIADGVLAEGDVESGHMRFTCQWTGARVVGCTLLCMSPTRMPRPLGECEFRQMRHGGWSAYRKESQR
jgi:hypothetical protein